MGQAPGAMPQAGPPRPAASPQGRLALLAWREVVLSLRREPPAVRTWQEGAAAPAPTARAGPLVLIEDGRPSHSCVRVGVVLPPEARGARHERQGVGGVRYRRVSSQHQCVTEVTRGKGSRRGRGEPKSDTSERFKRQRKEESTPPAQATASGAGGEPGRQRKGRTDRCQIKRVAGRGRGMEPKQGLLGSPGLNGGHAD